MEAARSDETGRDSSAPVVSALTAARWLFLLLVALAIPALPKLFARGAESGHTVGTYSLLWVTLLSIAGLLALAELALLVLLHTRASQPLSRFAASVVDRLAWLGRLNWVGVFVSWGMFVFVVLWRYQKHFKDFAPQVWLFWLLAGIGAVFWIAARKKTPFAAALLFVAIIYAAGIKALGYLPDISSDPFSLSWSEASRYYYASLPYSRWLYGFQVPLSSLHPTRYLLQSIAYWLPGAGLWFHRTWQVALWIVISLLTGLVLARRLKLGSFTALLVGALWSALFLLQGPVYYHLQVCAILVLFGYAGSRGRRFWRTLLFVVLASAWAGISRVNWIPVPAFLAAALYMIEKPVCENAAPGQAWPKTWLRYLWPPVAWGVAGGLAALASQAAYVLVSGHQNASDFGTSFTSALLWYRLLPSQTFPLGVLPAILLVSAPLLVLIVVNWLRGRPDWHPLRVIGLSALAAILFVGGLVVSAKIGGGSNIHNMDAYLVLLLVIGASIGAGQFAAETGEPVRVWRPWLLLLLVVAAPVIWNLDIGNPFFQRDMKQADYDLNKLSAIVQDYTPRGEVLFITQRQLVIFHLVPGVKMVSDYELVTLMEMSISNNRAYLDRFHKDLQDHRFALIVADRQHQDIIDPEEYGFAEENNAWVENVSKPLLKYYTSQLYFDTQGIQLLVPKK